MSGNWSTIFVHGLSESIPNVVVGIKKISGCFLPPPSFNKLGQFFCTVGFINSA